MTFSCRPFRVDSGADNFYFVILALRLPAIRPVSVLMFPSIVVIFFNVCPLCFLFSFCGIVILVGAASGYKGEVSRE